MTIHILRDYAPATSGYDTSVNVNAFTPQIYLLSLFLNKVLGYSIVGQTAWDINNTNVMSSTATATTPIGAGSNGQSLPQSTISATSTTGFPPSGTIFVSTAAGPQIVRYSGISGNNFLNCTGGTGLMTSGQSTTIAIGSNGATLPTGTINVASTAGFATTGTIYIVSTSGVQTVSYTNTNGTQFTGCSGGTGTLSTGNAVTSSGGSIACSPLIVNSAPGSPNVITTNFPHGLTTGQIAAFGNSTGGISNGPYQVTVNSPTQFIAMYANFGSGSPAGSATVFPPGLLLASGTQAGGTGASINISGASSVYQVGIPSAQRSVINGAAPSSGDVGRLLVLKSRSYPTKNSGIFKITAVDTVNNRYTIDYRSTDTPPPETGTLDWWVYEIETQASKYINWPNQTRLSPSIVSSTNSAPIQITYNNNVQAPFVTGMRVNISGHTVNTNANGNWTITVPNPTTQATFFTLNGSIGNGTGPSTGTITRLGYAGDGYALNSKIILQSPHSTGWQVRLAAEPWNVSLNPNTTVSVGYGGTSTGDFTIGGLHTHIAQFIDGSFTSQYVNAFTGEASQSFSSRTTIVGDDGGQAIFVYTRTQGGLHNGLLTFGIPDNEPTPTAPNTNRPFVYGSSKVGDYGDIQMRFGVNNNIGFTIRAPNPEVCGIAGFVNAEGNTGVSPVYSANAGDTPFTGTTETIPWEIWGGVATDPSLNLPFPSAGQTVYTINQRFMGTAPYIRQGRANFGAFTLSTDNTTAFTVTNATNASPIQITTQAANSLVTGQTVVISGVGTNTAANGTFTITVVDSTHFNLNGTTGNGTYSGGGTGNGTQQWIHLQNGIYLAWNGAGGLTP